jgi:hypothetical protein
MEPDESLPDPGIPEILHSAFAEAPFSTCVDCESKILDEAVPYAVEKVIRGSEVVFEYAMCARCMAILMQKFSEESLANITSYMQEQDFNLDSEGDGSSCHRCGAAEDQFQEEYTITGMLAGHHLLMGPHVICGSCLDGMDDILSQKTRDVHGEFVNDNFPGVPETLDFPVSVLGA